MINKHNIKNKSITNLLDLKNLQVQKSFSYYIVARLLNGEYPSKNLIREYCKLFPDYKKETTLENINKYFDQVVENTKKVKIGFKDKTKMPSIEVLEKLRDEILAINDFKFDKKNAIYYTVKSFLYIDNKPWKQKYIPFLDEVNKQIANGELKEEELKELYLHPKFPDVETTGNDVEPTCDIF